MIPMTEIPKMQATGETMGVGGVQKMSLPAPDEERVGAKPKKSQKKRQPRDSVLSDPAEQFLTEKGPQKSLGPLGNSPESGKAEPHSAQAAQQSTVQTSPPLQGAMGEIWQHIHRCHRPQSKGRSLKSRERKARSENQPRCKLGS